MKRKIKAAKEEKFDCMGLRRDVIKINESLRKLLEDIRKETREEIIHLIFIKWLELNDELKMKCGNKIPKKFENIKLYGRIQALSWIKQKIENIK